MITIEVTHFYYPNGRQKVETTELPDDVAAKYQEMRELGLRFTAEVLQPTIPLVQFDPTAPGKISLCIEDRELGDYAHAIVPNGPEVQQELAAMLRRFDRADFAKWQEEVG